MTENEDRTDAERIAVGLDPLQGEQLHDREDLRRVLWRLGHDLDEDDPIPTTRWELVVWKCPLDNCDGRLELVDTRMLDLPANADDLDASVYPDDADLYLRLSEAQSPNIPVVACYECHAVFEASFRQLRDSEERRLPPPRIVETPDTLSGRPRIDGTRIGVEHVLAFYEQGRTPDDIALEVYPSLSAEHVREAVEWAKAHPERMAELRRKDAEYKLRRDTLQAMVDAAVEETLDDLWSVLVNVRSREQAGDRRPVASILRNGFENAEGLDIHIDAEEGRVVIDVADEVVSRLNDDIDDSSR